MNFAYARGFARQPDSVRGIACMLTSIAMFAVMDANVKWLSASYPVSQLLFFRSLFSLVPVFIYLTYSGGLQSLKTRHMGGHFARSVIGLVSMGLFFLSFTLMPLADAVAIAFAGPLFITVLSVPMLGEAVGPRRWAAVFVGFLGILLIARPGGDLFTVMALLPLGAALSMAFAMIMVRRLASTESNAAIVFYFAVISTIATGAVMPFQWVTPAPADWLPLIALGVIGGTAQLIMTNAYRLAQVAVVAPFKYIAIIFAIIFGFVLWGDVPDSSMLLGAAVVIASGLYILHRETVRKAERQVAPPS